MRGLLLLATISLSAQSPGLTRSLTVVDMVERIPFGAAAVSLDGTLIVADFVSDTFKEIRDGHLVREYPKVPYSRSLLAAFGSLGETYLLYRRSQGYVVHVFSDDGELTQRILLTDVDFLAAAFQVSSQGQLLLLRNPATEAASEDLIFCFNPDGSLSASFLAPGAGAGTAQANTARMAVGTSDDLAVFIPELGAVYWLNSGGDLVRAVAATSLVTGVGLVEGELWIATSRVEVLPARADRPGFRAARLLEAEVQRVPRFGLILGAAAPAELKGITHIGTDGTLFGVTNTQLVIARP
jgi:hypothetical protein